MTTGDTAPVPQLSPPDPTLVVLRAAHTAWARYASACHGRRSTEERALTYNLARTAEQRLWEHQGVDAARAPGAAT